MIFTRAFIIISMLFLSALASAKEIVPFTQNGFARGYDALLKTIEKGDQLLLPDGRRYKIEGVLGKGTSTLILDLGNVEGKSLAVRIPIGEGVHPKTGLTYSEMLQSYFNGYERLHEAKLTIEIYPEMSNAKYYVFVEKLEDFAEYHGHLQKMIFEMPSVQKKRYEEAFIEFAKKTAVFKNIGDFHQKNIIFDEKRGEFLMLDWVDLSYEFNSVRESNVFEKNSKWFWLPHYKSNEERLAFHTRVKDVINFERRKIAQERMRNTALGKTVDCFVRFWKRIKD